MGEARRRNERIGSMPVQDRYREAMNEVAKHLDRVFNGDAKGDARGTGFVLLAYPMHGHKGRCNYISNSARADVVTLLKEQLAYFEGQPEPVDKPGPAN